MLCWCGDICITIAHLWSNWLLWINVSVQQTDQPTLLTLIPSSLILHWLLLWTNTHTHTLVHTHTHLYTHSTMMWTPISPSYSSLSCVLIMSQWPFHITPHLSFFIFSFQPPSFPRTPLFNPSHISFLCITSFFWSVLEHNGLTLHLNPIAILISITLTCRCTLLSTSFLSQFWSGITIVGIYQVMKVINKPLLPNQNRSKNQFSNWNRVECRPFDTMWRFESVSIFLIHFNANCSPPISHNSNLDGVSEIFMSSLQLFLHNSLSNNI